MICLSGEAFLVCDDGRFARNSDILDFARKKKVEIEPESATEDRALDNSSESLHVTTATVGRGGDASQFLDRILSKALRKRVSDFLKVLSKFIGPGYLVAIGYFDPGNWASDLAGNILFSLFVRSEKHRNH